MEDKKILQKAILIAEKNGYKGHLGYLPMFLKRCPEKKEKFTKQEFMDLVSELWLRHKNDIIFDHSFAKAFWGNEIICKDGGTYDIYLKSCIDAGMTKEEAKLDWEIDEHITLPKWQYWLQRIVLEAEPLKYIGRFL